MKFKTAEEAIHYIQSKVVKNKVFDSIKQLFEQYDNFQNELKCIHVAGTNGKGSTTHFLATILQESGYMVGTFTSPYLIKHNDRIRINNQYIEDQTLLELVNRYYEDFEKYQLNFFAIDTFLCLRYFYEQQVDYCVIEVGLGGRFDATNIITPLISVITSINYDHMAILGNTLEEISYEKAGIIKKNGYCIVGYVDDLSFSVISSYASEMNARITRNKIPTQVKIKNNRCEFEFDNQKFQINSLALYQTRNASLAIKVAQELNQFGLCVPSNAIHQGILRSNWLGRFEKMCDNPLVFIDGAHNEEGIQALIETLKIFKKDYKISILFSALKDKETSKMIDTLMKVSDRFAVTTFDFYRAAPTVLLKGNRDIEVFENYQEAYLDFIQKATATTLIVVTGSLYFITKIREFILQQH